MALGSYDRNAHTIAIIKVLSPRAVLVFMLQVEFIFGGRWTLARRGAMMSRSEAAALVAALGGAGFVARVAR